MRVAIVDDTPDMRLLVRRSLELDPDIDVVAEAADGLEAIDVAARHHPEVMLLDLAMPVLDGIQALPRVVQASPETTVIVLSGFSADAMTNAALAAGARAYVQKGVAGRELCARVWEASGCQRPARSSPDDDGIISPPRLTSPAEGGDGEPIDVHSAELSAARAEIKRLRAAMARTAHELRSPVTVIAGLTEMSLGPDVTMSRSQQEQTQSAFKRQSELLTRLAADLEASSHIQGDQLLVELARVDIVKLVHAAITAAPQERDVTVLADPGAVAIADPARVLQIVSNLLSNAFKYGEPPYEVHVARTPEHVLVSVADRGPGVPDHFRPLLFDEFTRAHDDGRGTGLGLYVVRSLAEAQGGKVEHYERPHGGSVFTVTLRAATGSD